MTVYFSFTLYINLTKILFSTYMNPVKEGRTKNPRFDVGGGEISHVATIIRNATLWNGDGKVSNYVDIKFKDGVIISVGPTRDLDEDTATAEEIIDAKGRFVTPGLVDLHSHMGTDSWPGTEGGSDTNEMSDSLTVPFLKSLDGFDPTDLAIGIINSGGVTTSLVLPGSGNHILIRHDDGR
jgi:imidazolonepropionase-like amidohydrolase